MHGMASEPASPSFRLDIDGIRFSHGAAATTMSPVFSLWLTFVLMYIGEPQLVACDCFTAKAAAPFLVGVFCGRSLHLHQMHSMMLVPCAEPIPEYEHLPGRHSSEHRSGGLCIRHVTLFSLFCAERERVHRSQ